MFNGIKLEQSLFCIIMSEPTNLFWLGLQALVNTMQSSHRQGQLSTRHAQSTTSWGQDSDRPLVIGGRYRWELSARSCPRSRSGESSTRQVCLARCSDGRLRAGAVCGQRIRNICDCGSPGLRLAEVASATQAGGSPSK